VIGGSSFAAAYNFAELEASKCTTSAISIDRRSPFHLTTLISPAKYHFLTLTDSAYWAPQLYWIVDPANPNNTTFLQLSELLTNHILR
jgi:hypothetical protein